MAEKRVGVTGADSFIGRALVSEMQDRGREVVRFGGDILRPADVLEFARSCDVIFHLAGRNRGDPIEVFRVGAVGTANLVVAAASLGRRHIIFPSSNHVERDPRSAYSQAKLESERLLRVIGGQAGCRATVFRLPNVYGPGALPFYVSVVATFSYLQALGRGDEMPIVGDGMQRVTLVPLYEVVRQFMESMNQEETFQLVPISGEDLSIRELAEIIRGERPADGWPVIRQCIGFFSRPGPDVRLHAGLTSLSHSIIGEREVLEVSGDYPWVRPSPPQGTDWVILSRGRLIVDLHSRDGDYLNSTLLEVGRIAGTGITRDYCYAVRATDPEGATALIVRQSHSR